MADTTIRHAIELARSILTTERDVRVSRALAGVQAEAVVDLDAALAALADQSQPTKTLPPLPQPYATSVTWHGYEGSTWQQWHDATDPMPTEWDDEAPDEVVHVYTADQMRAYAAAALATQAQAEPVAWWIPAAEQFTLAKKGERPFAKAWEPLYTAPLPAAQPVADERDEEIERLRDLVIRQGTQLRRIVNIVRGDPAEGCAHSTHDAADLVYDLKMHSDQYAMAVEHEQRAAQPVRQPLTREQEAAHELLEALREIADDYAGRFDLDDPSTNPGIRYTITQARAAIAKATGQEGGAA